MSGVKAMIILPKSHPSVLLEWSSFILYVLPYNVPVGRLGGIRPNCERWASPPSSSLTHCVCLPLYQSRSLPKITNSSPASTPLGPGSTWSAGTTAAVRSPPSSWSTERWTRPPGPRPSARRWPRATSCTTCRRRPGTSCRWRSPTAPARRKRGSPLPLSMQTEVSLRGRDCHSGARRARITGSGWIEVASQR